MANEHGPFNSEREALATRAAAALRAACDANPRGWEAEHLKVMTEACESIGVPLGAFDLAPFRQLAMYEAFNAVVIAGIIHRAFEAGRASALRGGTPLTVQPDAVCGGLVPDPGDAEFAYDCANHSRFLVERSDGDKSFGENGGSTEACAGHLADAVTGMIDGDENIRAIVSIRWNAPEGEDSERA